MGITLCLCPNKTSEDINSYKIVPSSNTLLKQTQTNYYVCTNYSLTLPSIIKNNNNNQSPFENACLEGIVKVKPKSRRESPIS
jgi:hypothetical protein